MIENKLICTLLGFILVFATLPSEAKIFWFDYPVAKQSPEDGVSTFRQPYVHREQKRDPIELIYKVIKQLVTSRQKHPKPLDDVESMEHKCARLFGSIYGTKQQRLLCLENLKNKRKKKENFYAKKTNNIHKKHVFTDLTRAVDSSDSNIRTDIFYSPEFSSDYIDFKDLRTNNEAEEYFKDNWRKSNWKNAMDSIKHQRTLYTSDSDSDESVEVKKKYSKKPKRFQVIDNDQSREDNDQSREIGQGNNDDSDNDSSDSDGDQEESIPAKKDINLNNEHYLQGNYDSSDLEYKKPVKASKMKEHYLQGNDDLSEDEFEVKTNKKKSNKKKTNKKKWNQKKEYYLQSGRLISPSSVEDGRRRLQHFLPKRFHWNEEDMQNLGYFWFNGPQGRYPYYPMRP